MQNRLLENVQKHLKYNLKHNNLKAFDDGAVTAEFSVVLPAVVLLALVLFGVGRAVVCSMNCHDAAAQVAYYIVTHRNTRDVNNIVTKVAGPGASVRVTKNNNFADIVVRCQVFPDPLHILPTVVESRISQVVS